MNFSVREKCAGVKQGDRFTRLLVLGHQFRLRYDQLNKTEWWCVVRCDCGAVFALRVYALKTKNTLSCGCLNLDLSRTRKNRLTHGETATPLHRLWAGIKMRCRNPKRACYHNYGGRGIDVCDEWFDSYEVFREYALSVGYKEGLEIDRIDNNGDYEPGNIRFVERLCNVRNRRMTVFVEMWGQRKTLGEWAKDARCRVRYCCLWARIFTRGWEPERAMVTPSAKDKS